MASIPVCDMECQRQKQLSSLLIAMNSATDPDAHEQARIKYFTLKDGQGWLAKEKEILAKKEIEPVLTNLENKYNLLQNRLKDAKERENIFNQLKSQQIQDEHESVFMKQQIMKESDKVGVAQRLSQFGISSSWSSTTLDIVIAVICLFIGYSIIKRVRG